MRQRQNWPFKNWRAEEKMSIFFRLWFPDNKRKLWIHRMTTCRAVCIRVVNVSSPWDFFCLPSPEPFSSCSVCCFFLTILPVELLVKFSHVIWSGDHNAEQANRFAVPRFPIPEIRCFISFISHRKWNEIESTLFSYQVCPWFQWKVLQTQWQP